MGKRAGIRHSLAHVCIVAAVLAGCADAIREPDASALATTAFAGRAGPPRLADTCWDGCPAGTGGWARGGGGGGAGPVPSQLDAGVPPNPSCGNAAIDPGELCDGTNLNAMTCRSLGFASGELRCNLATCFVDTTYCKIGDADAQERSNGADDDAGRS